MLADRPDDAPALTVGRDETGVYVDVGDIHDPAAMLAAMALVTEVWRREHPDLVTDNAIGPFAGAATNGHQPAALAEAEAAVTEARTDPHGWPHAIPDDRVPVGDDEPLPAPPTAPDILGVLYSDKHNVIAGEAGCCKTWIALEAAARLEWLGQRVVWLDAEDSASVVSERLTRLGHRDLTRSFMFRRVNHSDWIDADPIDRAAISKWLTEGPLGTGHLFIDSGTASGSGTSPDDFAGWAPHHLVHVGVTVLEHVAKNPEQRFGPSGSLRKATTATGMTAMVEGLGWTKDTPSSVNLRVVKDRPGGTGKQRGELFATVYGSAHPDGSVTIDVRPPREESAAYLPLILAAVEDDPGIGARKLRDAVAEAAKIAGHRSDWETVANEIKEAVLLGRIVKTKGTKNRVHHTLPHTPD